ncbi:MAG: hypothetical protein IJJ42_00385 [Clostridia bacterium]|nr:hypothetical protein [Clostridia bacterium]
MPQSATWLKIISTGAEVHFSAVTRIQHNLSLKVASETNAAEAADYLNGARKQPARVTLTLTETDTGHPAGWAARTAEILELLRSSRTLVNVYTPIRTYTNMLLSDLVILQEEGNPLGWTGTAAFTESAPAASAVRNDNSSAVTHTGSRASSTVSSGSSSGTVIYDSPLRQLLARSGIEVFP